MPYRNDADYTDDEDAGGAYGASSPRDEAELLEAAVAWKGAPVTLQVYDAATMQTTPTGTMAFNAQQSGTGNNAGTLQLASGGSTTQLNVPPGLQQPVIQVSNWGGSSLTVTNISTPGAGGTPIIVQAMGPGLPGMGPAKQLPSTGTIVSIGQYAVATGLTTANPQTTLRVACTSGNAVVVIIGGPTSNTGNPPTPNNGYVVALNALQTYGPPSGTPVSAPVAPAQYYASTSNNTYDFVMPWQSYSLFVGNMSSVNSAVLNLQMF